MTSAKNKSDFYQIRVQGHLPDSWSDWFGGFKIKTHPNGETVMTGEIIDQTALHTLIQRIRDIGLTLVEVSVWTIFKRNNQRKLEVRGRLRIVCKEKQGSQKYFSPRVISPKEANHVSKHVSRY
jgi:hypothetical protein